MKPFWQSKTLWFNAAAALATVFWPTLQQALGMTPEQAGGIVIIGNMLLRLITSQGVTVK